MLTSYTSYVFPWFVLVPISSCRMYLNLRRLKRAASEDVTAERDNSPQAQLRNRSTALDDSWFVRLTRDETML
ncbi:hypothetical protein CALCODRAFT_501183, partial [Calocera cornea HHB12733]